jgi:hypothetical protein
MGGTRQLRLQTYSVSAFVTPPDPGSQGLPGILHCVVDSSSMVPAPRLVITGEQLETEIRCFVTSP